MTVAQEKRQQGELAWWVAHLPRFRDRIIGLYGMRYLPYFFEEFNDLKLCADVGSGPISASVIAEKVGRLICIDPLGPEYVRAGIADQSALNFYAPDKAARSDYVLCLNALDHTDEPLAMLRDCAALLKPSGKLLLWTHLGAGDKLHADLTIDAVLLAAHSAHLLWSRKEIVPGGLGPAVLRGVLRLA